MTEGKATPPATEASGPRPTERQVMTVEEVAAALGLSRNSAYAAVADGQIPSIRIGRRIFVPKAAFHRLLEGPQPGKAA